MIWFWICGPQHLHADVSRVVVISVWNISMKSSSESFIFRFRAAIQTRLLSSSLAVPRLSCFFYRGFLMNRKHTLIRTKVLWSRFDLHLAPTTENSPYAGNDKTSNHAVTRKHLWTFRHHLEFLNLQHDWFWSLWSRRQTSSCSGVHIILTSFRYTGNVWLIWFDKSHVNLFYFTSTLTSLAFPGSFMVPWRYTE